MREPRARRRVRQAAALPVLVLALLTGCMLPGLGGVGGGGDGDETEGAGPDPDSTATMPTEVPSWLLECGSDENKGGDRDDSLQLSTLDLTQATWSTPAGFATASGYAEDNPVETLHSEWIVEPTDPPQPSLNVVNVVIYTGVDWGDLADGCGRVPLEAVEEKLARYREQISAQPMSEAQMTELAGLPAIQQDIGLASYDYTGYWLFTETQLLHLYCQWTDPAYEPTIRSGCDSVAASLQVPGA